MKINLIHSRGIASFAWTITHARALIRTREQAQKLHQKENVSLFKVLNLMLTRPVPGGPGFDGWTILWGQRSRVSTSFRVFTDRIEIATTDLSKIADVEQRIRSGGSVYSVTRDLHVRHELIRAIVQELGLEEMARKNGFKNRRAIVTGSKRSFLKPEERQLVERLLNSGLTVKQIHLQTNISTHKIKHYILGTPFDQIAEQNAARYHFRLEEQKRRAQKEFPSGVPTRPAPDLATVKKMVLPPEMVKRIEDLILARGLTVPAACIELQTEGFSISEYKLYKFVDARPDLKEIATQNAYLNWCQRAGQTNKAEKPAFIYERYYLLSKRDGILLIDRMSERFSTAGYWMEWGIAEYPPTQLEQARCECRRRNARWHRELASKNKKF